MQVIVNVGKHMLFVFVVENEIQIFCLHLDV